MRCSAGRYARPVSRIAIVGVPSSAASYAAGQDLAPAAMRAAGLPAKLIAAGLEMRDEGDLPVQVWKPDREHPLAQNPGPAAESLRQLAGLLRRCWRAVTLHWCSAATAPSRSRSWRRCGAWMPGAPGLLYADRHYDLNTPDSTTDGALDWMGLAHALALPGCVDVLTDAFGARPGLEPYQVAWLGVQPQRATDWEREQAARLGLHVTTGQALAADPAGAAAAALDRLPGGPLAVHIDVDVLDFTDAPLAEDTGGRNTGPTLGQADNRPSRWPREIHGQERCRSANSTRPAAPCAPRCASPLCRQHRPDTRRHSPRITFALVEARTCRIADVASIAYLCAVLYVASGCGYRAFRIVMCIATRAVPGHAPGAGG